MQIFDRYANLINWVNRGEHRLRVLGHTLDGSPVVCCQNGGEKKPSIFISAGSHSTEQAGVTAAVELIDQLTTDHQVYVIPCRDPMGMNGFSYALSLSLGEEPELDSAEDIEQILRDVGEVLYQDEETLLVIIGEYGYSTSDLYGRFPRGESFLEPLIGRRIFFPSSAEGIEGTAPFQRAYTLVVSPEGEILHINRFHDTSWAPVEVQCVRRLMAEIQPGLTLDLHEYSGDAFWFSARHQQSDEDQVWEKKIADGIIQTVAESKIKLVEKGYLPGSFFTRSQPGVFWLNPQQRGEGLNLADFAANQYGLSFTIETGMQSGFQHRVSNSMLAVQTAVDIFEQRYP